MFIITTDYLNDHFSLRQYQVIEIEAAIDEADREEFASDEVVIDLFKKWGVT